jgi:hypothetical protein
LTRKPCETGDGKDQKKPLHDLSKLETFVILAALKNPEDRSDRSY